MRSKLPLNIVVGLAACTWALVLVGLGTPIPNGFFKPLSIVAGAVALLLAAFDRWVWRWPGVRDLVGLPDLEGTWIGAIRSNWADPKTKKGAPTIRAAIVVRQTSTAITVTLFSKESQSVTVAGSLAEGPDGRFEVCSLYRNEPRLSLQERSRMHYGGLRLQVAGDGEERLVGSYWTDRDTHGEIEFTFVTRKRARDFDGAMEMGAPGEIL